MPSPVRFSPISTLKPSRLSSSATSRASLIGSFSGASASGYFALPITSAKRSPAASDGTIDATEKINVTSNARRIFIMTAIQITQSSQKGADPSLRLGDLTLRKPHYQTAPAARQPLARPSLIATINRDEAGRWRRNKPRLPATVVPRASDDGGRRQCDRSHIERAMLSCSRHARSRGLTFADDNGLVLASANREPQEK